MDANGFSAVYTDIRPINHGGTGTIFLAFHRNLGKYVILKKLADSQDERVLRREMEILKNLKHRFLPVIYDYLRLDDGYYLVEDYIRGCDLNRYISTGTFVPEEYAVKWFRQLCEVLEYLHTRRPAVIHSDIKPGNVMIDENGDVCLIDFNISVLRGESVSVVGFSKYYCAPEQLAKVRSPGANIPIDARTDVYSAAATFYTLLSGALPDPERGSRPLAGMGLPYSEGFLRLLDKAMSPDMSRRWQSAKQMSAQFDHLSRLTKKHRVMAALAAVGAAVLILSSAAVIFGVNAQNRQSYAAALRGIEARLGVSGVDEALVADVQSVLSDGRYSSYLAKDDETSAYLSALLAEYYMSLNTVGGYSAAAEYYADAWEKISASGASESVREEYGVNYAVALAMSGDSGHAKIFAYDSLRQNELWDAAIGIGAEYQKENYSGVLALARTVKTGSDSASVRLRLCRTVALAALMDGDASGAGCDVAADLLGRQAAATPTDDFRRLLLGFCLSAGNLTGDGEYFGKAAEYYEKIGVKTDADRLDYAECLCGSGRYGDCISAIEKLAPGDDALSCRRAFLLSLSSLKTGGRAAAERYWDEMASLYRKIPQRRRETSVDVSAMRALGAELGKTLD